MDDEYADVRVKLYSDSEFGKHIIRLMSEKDTLEDLHTVVGAINNAPDEVKEELEQYILYDQLNLLQSFISYKITGSNGWKK